MNATLTLVLCLASNPESCEVRDLQVDAQSCFYGGSNVAAANTPEGFVLKSARCVPLGRQGEGQVPRGPIRPPTG